VRDATVAKATECPLGSFVACRPRLIQRG
jgi:hypothetical protein